MTRRGFSAVLAGFRRPSGKVLVAVNLALLPAVLYFDWSVFDIVFLYWAENLVIGAINVLKMAFASPDPLADRKGPESRSAEDRPRPPVAARAAGWIAKLFTIPFFIVHYGGFCVGHGVFVFALFNESGEWGDDLWSALPALVTGALGLSLAALAASHLYSFFVNYLGSGEFRRTDVRALMMRPYGRIVALHLTILLGGFVVAALGDPIFMLVVLVVLKTFVDLAMHGRERLKYLDATPATVTS